MKKCRRLYFTLIFTFFLGLQEGKIVLWQDGDPQPQHVFPYRAETLPPPVRRALEESIAFQSAGEAMETAENFLS